MMDICQRFVASRNLKFGTHVDPTKSKTKCNLFSKNNIEASEVKPIRLDGNELPWVDNVKHLEHILEKDNSMKLDISKKRGMFIGSFYRYIPVSSLKSLAQLQPIFMDAIYGICLVKKCEKLYKSYNVALRNILRIDRCSHRYLLEPLSRVLHLKTMLSSKFVSQPS